MDSKKLDKIKTDRINQLFKLLETVKVELSGAVEYCKENDIVEVLDYIEELPNQIEETLWR